MSIEYGTADQAITITVTSLADAAARESTVITNASGFDDVLVFGKTQISVAPTGLKLVEVYAYATVGGTEYPDAVTGADAGITLTNPTNLRPLGVIRVPTENVSHKAGPWSLRAVFGGSLPQKWGIVVKNRTGQSLTGTGSHHGFTYQGLLG